MKIFRKVQQALSGTKFRKVTNFFDYSADEKAKIIREAVKESNKMQTEILDKYNKQFAA